MARISIIVPLYNMESTLSKTLDSLVNQSLKDIEILCIDDGSTDSSPDILKDYQAKYPSIKVFRKDNGGIASARNFGLSKVKAPYFAFVDSDDTVEPTMMEELYLKAIETKAQLVFCDFWWTYPNQEKIQHDGPYSSQKELLIGMFATLWNKLYDTAWVKSLKIDFPDGYRYEDASFLYKLVPYTSHWAYIRKPFIHYLQREGSITHNHNDKVKDMIHVFEDLLVFYKDRGFYEPYHAELEYLFTRFFLGNSFLRTCQINDKADRINTLNLSYSILNNHFPKWRTNPYLKQRGLKNFVFRLMTKNRYFLLAWLLHHLYSFKKSV